MNCYIKRYPLKFTDNQEIELPMKISFEILSAEVFNGETVLYLLMDRDGTKFKKYIIYLFLTEQSFIYEKDYSFLGSVNVKGVTAHIFSKEIESEIVKENISLSSGDYTTFTPSPQRDEIQKETVKKKRGRPKKYKESEN